MSEQFPPCPASLRTIQHYLKVASDYDQKDPVISYWCRLYALQSGLKIDRSSHEAKVLLSSLMDWLERQKRALSDNEAVGSDLAAQAYVESYALKLFLYADGKDRAANFGKDVVRAFYTAGLLYDVMTTFGELTEEVAQNRKYAKWKAAYIHKCLKEGEVPQPGPMREEGDDEAEEEEGAVGGLPAPGPSSGGIGFGFAAPPGASSFPEPPSGFPEPPSGFPPSSGGFLPSPHSNPYSGPANPYNPPPTPTQVPTTPVSPDVRTFPATSAGGNGDSAMPAVAGGVTLTADQITKAQKYCKWAGSALSYDDVPNAIENVKKALKLLETGVDS